mgnify:FL=1
MRQRHGIIFNCIQQPVLFILNSLVGKVAECSAHVGATFELFTLALNQSILVNLASDSIS